MALDKDLLRVALDAESRMADQERELERAKADYHHAVRRLHRSGGSLREIATTLGLSHQRVHQIVDKPRPRRWRRTSHSHAPLTCSFCGRRQRDTAKLIAGPGVYICAECVRTARVITGVGDAGPSADAPIEAVGPEEALRCSFCSKASRQRRLVAGPGVQICTACLDLCQEIITDDASAAPPPRTI